MSSFRKILCAMGSHKFITVAYSGDHFKTTFTKPDGSEGKIPHSLWFDACKHCGERRLRTYCTKTISSVHSGIEHVRVMWETGGEVYTKCTDVYYKNLTPRKVATTRRFEVVDGGKREP